MTELTENRFAQTLSEEDYNAFKIWIKSVLKQSSATVDFIKKDGTNRKLVCTLDPELIPGFASEDTEKEKTRKVNEEALAVYDLEAGAWRSFRYDGVTSVELKIKNENE